MKPATLAAARTRRNVTVWPGASAPAGARHDAASSPVPRIGSIRSARRGKGPPRRGPTRSRATMVGHARRRRARPRQDVPERLAAAAAYAGAARREPAGAARRHLRPARPQRRRARPRCSPSSPRCSCPTAARRASSATTSSARPRDPRGASTWRAATRRSCGACARARCWPSTARLYGLHGRVLREPRGRAHRALRAARRTARPSTTSSPPGSSSGSPSPRRCSTSPRCSSSTSRPSGSIPTCPSASAPRSPRSGASGAPRSS